VVFALESEYGALAIFDIRDTKRNKEMNINHQMVREYIVDELKKDLVGPGSINEELTDRPTIHYLTGILYPSESTIDTEEDQDANEALLRDDDTDIGAMMATAMNPSAIGLTFRVEKGEEIEFQVGSAYYLEEISPDTERFIWKRKQLELAFNKITVIGDDVIKKELTKGLELLIRIRDRKTHVVVTASLINRLRPVSKNESRDKYCFFQPKISVRSTETNKPIFLKSNTYNSDADPDRKLFDLLYRHAPQFSVGHGCAVEWNVNPGENAYQLETKLIPGFEVLKISPDRRNARKAQEMEFLATGFKSELAQALKEFLVDYEEWLKSIEKNSLPEVPESLKPIGIENLENCKEALTRMMAGYDLIIQNDNVMKAFQLTNLSMLTQRARSIWARKNKNERPEEPLLSSEHRWRPFQLGFILLCIQSIVEGKDPYRDTVDLLWFPTGGGKTEAYLGLSAFTIFYRRIIADNKSKAAGVTVLMRYTLRLLTLQQFQRAATLIMACESIRRTREPLLGTDPISLGLWIGGGGTPNTIKSAKIALKKLLSGEEVFEGNPMQILSCPWCGQPLSEHDYTISTGMVIHCPDENCLFHNGMPLYLVDEDIYNKRPTLVLGTVDKFARLPWMSQASSIFGLPDKRNYPPELIIQDELHLISGPLGTLTGLYETAIDTLCQRNDIAPKIIASTATIRKASEQTLGLYSRNLKQFPPPALDVRDNFFSFELPAKESPGRLYLGIHAPGRSMKTTLLRVYANLLQKIAQLEIDDSLKDPYWTLIGYFNSLRELGGAVRLVEDDIPGRMKVITHGGENQRYLNDVKELNSRVKSTDIPEILEKLSTPMKNNRGAIDVVLATNMISVGMDVDRLGLMVVNGQPKLTSEYIQASSRVGRRFPGLVVTLYNWTRPRDRSHYERFSGYHSAFYSQVEATGVTTFSSRARDKALHSILISLVRHMYPEMNPESAAKNFVRNSTEVQTVLDIILDRVKKIDPLEFEETQYELERICERWEKMAQKEELTYSDRKSAHQLLLSAEIAQQFGSVDSFSTLNAMRDVEGACGIFFIDGGS
jgi:Helicase conserved C-terminal domain